MDTICPKCGINSSKRKFIGNFCADCYSSMVKLDVPREISIPRCRMCGKIRTREWVRESGKAISDFILSKVKGGYSGARAETETNPPRITFVVEKDGSFIELQRAFSLEFPGAMCQDCSRKTGGYFEATIQLRGEPGKVERALRRLEKKLDFSKVEELKEGIDLYSISKKKTAEALSELKFPFTTSNKLFGLKEGQRVYRTTFCVRLR